MPKFGKKSKLRLLSCDYRLQNVLKEVIKYVDCKDRERFHLFAGFVLGIARSMDIKLRWGGDWNMNFEVDDNKFDDFPHFELKE